MLGRLLRVVFGYVVACLAAGLTKVLFVYTPVHLASLPPEQASDQLATAFGYALPVGIIAALFGLPFALIGILYGEWRRVQGWVYYAMLGIAIAMLGFLAQYNSEIGTGESVMAEYPIAAFLWSGFVGGLVYWMLSGRFAGPAAAAAPVKLTTAAKNGSAKPAVAPASTTSGPKSPPKPQLATAPTKPTGTPAVKPTSTPVKPAPSVPVKPTTSGSGTKS